MRSRHHPALTWLVAALSTGALTLRTSAQPDGPQASVDASLGRLMFYVTDIHEVAGQPPRLAIWIETEKALSCELPLSFRVQVTGNHVMVSNFSIPTEQACPSMVTVAAGVQALDILSGCYVLTISNRGTVDTYRLDITDTSIATTGSGLVSRPIEPLAWRIPRNTFVVGCGATGDTSWICDDASRLLSLEPGITPVSFPPTGHNPYGIGGRGTLRIESPHVYRYARRTDYDRVVADIKAFADRVIGPRTGTVITVDTWLAGAWETTP